MQIYTTLVIDIETGKTIKEEFYEYNGIIAECKGEKPSQTTTGPPDWQAEYLQDIAGQAKGESQSPLSYYPGQSVAGFTPEQTEAQNRAAARARAGSDLTRAGQNEILKTTRGDYVNPESNPWLKSFYDKAAEVAMPQIDTSAQQAGRYGSNAWGTMKGKTAADLATGIYGGAYNQERDRQAQATALAPQYAELDYNDISKIAAIGEEKRGMAQTLIDQDKAKHQFTEMEPYERLGLYSNLINGDWGGVTNTTYGNGKKWL